MNSAYGRIALYQEGERAGDLYSGDAFPLVYGNSDNREFISVFVNQRDEVNDEIGV